MKDKIEVKYDTSKYIKNEFLNIFINNKSITEICDQEGLVPSFLFIIDEEEEELVWNIFESNSKKILTLPILICSEDLDLSCYIEAVEVQKLEDSVKWLRFGYGDTDGLEEDSIRDIPSFEFDKNEYAQCIRVFKSQRDIKLCKETLFSFIDYLFSLDKLTIYENYSAFGKELKTFNTANKFKTFIEEEIKNKKHHNQFKLLYKNMRGSVSIKKIHLNPKACNGHTIRYESISVGTIGLSFKLNRLDRGITCSIYSKNKKEIQKDLKTLSENISFYRWNWKFTERSLNEARLKLDVIKNSKRIF